MAKKKKKTKDLSPRRNTETRSIEKRSEKAGLSPGTIVHLGDRKTEAINIELFEYEIKEFATLSFDELISKELSPQSNIWLNVNGLHEVEKIKKIGGIFGLHSLVLEDIVNTRQRSKLEVYDDYIYLVLKMLTYNIETYKVSIEQVSVIIGKNFLLSFQEEPGDVFDSVRNRLKKGKLGKEGVDYLAHSLIDAVVDSYFVILEEMGEDIEYLETLVINNPEPDILQSMHHLKRQSYDLRKHIWPLREVLRRVEQGNIEFITDNVQIYFRDVQDHLIQIIEIIDTHRDILSSMMDLYFNSVSSKMNEVMKVLTFIATIFIPLSFVAGVYGMNFHHMPELSWRWGYAFVWGIMVCIVLTMLMYFRRKQWL